MAKQKDYLKTVIRDGETVMYKGEPKAKSEFVANLTALIIVSLLSIIGDCFFVGAGVAVGIVDKNKSWIIIVFLACLVIHIIPELFWLMNIFEKQTKLDNTRYYITDKRVMSVYKMGEICVTEEIPYSSVTEVKVKGGAIRGAYGTKTVILCTANEKFRLLSVSDYKKVIDCINSLLEREDFEEKQDLQTDEADALNADVEDVTTTAFDGEENTK